MGGLPYDQEHTAYGIEGQFRMASGVVLDALLGQSNITDASECEGRHWDNAKFFDLNATIPIAQGWNLTGGYFMSTGTVQVNDPAQRTELRIGAQYTPEGSNWTFLSEASLVDYHQEDEGDRSEIASLYFGAKFEFGPNRDTRRPLLHNAARPLGRAIALAPAID